MQIPQTQFIGTFNSGRKTADQIKQIIKTHNPLAVFEMPDTDYAARFTFDPRDPSTMRQPSPPSKSINYRINLLNSLGARTFETFKPADPNLTFGEALQLRNRAIGEFAKNNGIDIIDFTCSEDGVMITARGGAQRFVLWEDLGFANNPFIITEGYTFIRSNIFGNGRIEGGLNPTPEAVIEMMEKYRAMTEQWIAANGHSPDFSNVRFELSYVLMRARCDFINNATRYRALLAPPGHFMSSDRAIATFIADFERIIGQKQAIIAELTEYYSIEAITQRARNAGFADDAELLERIIETQTRYGENLIRQISIQSPFSLDDNLETALERFLTAGINDRGGSSWNFNNIQSLFGVEQGSAGMEARQIMAQDIIRATLTGNERSIIRVGEIEMTYREFLDMERIVTETFRRFAGILARQIMGAEMLADVVSRAMPGIRGELERWLDKQSNPNIKIAVVSWFNDTLEQFNHINQQRVSHRLQTTKTGIFANDSSQWRFGTMGLTTSSQGFDISKVNAVYVSFMDMLLQ